MVGRGELEMPITSWRVYLLGSDCEAGPFLVDGRERRLCLETKTASNEMDREAAEATGEDEEEDEEDASAYAVEKDLQLER